MPDNNTTTMTDDVIAGIATARGAAAVAILRLSGDGVFEQAESLIVHRGKPLAERPSGRFFLATVQTPSGKPIDQALILIMRAPRSYTGEDTIEIQCHGGPVTADRILQAALETGARLAEPGEFTRRAFLNGRMDLVQAEGVADLIRAQTDAAAKAALVRMEGGLSRILDGIYRQIIEAAVEIEARLDFDENELGHTTAAAITEKLTGPRQALHQLLHTWSMGQMLNQGARLVILGQPNVGKSTLFNALLGSNRAIVSPTPGTTRDTIEAHIEIRGIAMTLIDTAGLRESSCAIEREGIQRTRSESERAHFTLFVIDASRKEHVAEDIRELKTLNPADTLVVINKTDLGAYARPAVIEPFRCIEAAIPTGKGLTDITQAIESMLAITPLDGHEVMLSNQRQNNAIENALRALDAANTLAKEGREESQVLVAQHIRDASEQIGYLLGRGYSTDVLDGIFHQFCVGK